MPNGDTVKPFKLEFSNRVIEHLGSQMTQPSSASGKHSCATWASKCQDLATSCPSSLRFYCHTRIAPGRWLREIRR